MNQETKSLVVVWTGVVLSLAAFFGTATAITIHVTNNGNKEYSQCIENNMQWINGSCVK